MKSTLILLFFLCICNSFCQEKDFEILGRSLAESILKNDSISFHSLILPKKAVIEKIKKETKDKLSTEAIASTVKNINENYNSLVSSTFSLSFLNLVTKTNIFNLNLKNVTYKVVETEETKNDPSIFAVRGTIDHSKFQYFTFYASKFEEKLYVASPLIQISEVNKFEERKRLKEVKLSSDENGNLISKGTIELDNSTTSKKDILNCILNAPITIGVEETSKFSDNTSAYEYIKGKWEYTYYVNDLSDFAGIVEFKYEFKISDGKIDYEYYDF